MSSPVEEQKRGQSDSHRLHLGCDRRLSPTNGKSQCGSNDYYDLGAMLQCFWYPLRIVWLFDRKYMQVVFWNETHSISRPQLDRIVFTDSREPSSATGIESRGFVMRRRSQLNDPKTIAERIFVYTLR